MGLLLDLLHLTAWGQLGVLIRYYLDKLFGVGCTQGSSWLPCVTSPGLIRYGGALFTDVASNIAGCMIMGLLSPADVLLLGRTPPIPAPAPLAQPQPKAGGQETPAAQPVIQPGLPIACLPRKSPLQKHTSLLLGLRTGLCGCLTTFATWVLQMVEMMVGSSPSNTKMGSEWFEAVCGLIIGCLVSQAALVAGQQLARRLAGFWHQRDADHAARQPAGPLDSPGQPQATLDNLGQADTAHVHVGLQPPVQMATLEPADRKGAVAVASPAETKGQAGGPDEAKGWSKATTLCALCNLAAALTLLVLSCVSVALIVVVAVQGIDEAAGAADFILWVSLLTSPLGCLLRWRLSALNTRSADSAFGTWFPLGTWLANMGGCLVDYIMSVIMLRAHGLSHISSEVLSGVMTGVGGSLSTVSTWVVELQRLGIRAHSDSHSLQYLLGSLVPAVTLGLLVYGTAVWTLP